MSHLDHVAQHLASAGLRFERMAGRGLKGMLQGRASCFQLLVTESDWPPVISIVAPSLMEVPDERLDEVVRLANQLNAQHLLLGVFWVGPKLPMLPRRFLAFEVAILAPDIPSEAQVYVALKALAVVDDFFPAFALVMWGQAAAEQALQQVRDAAREESWASPGHDEDPSDDADGPPSSTHRVV